MRGDCIGDNEGINLRDQQRKLEIGHCPFCGAWDDDPHHGWCQNALLRQEMEKPMLGAFSKATTVNPKDLFGAKKVSITKLPAIGVLHGAHAMMDGAKKYGPYNWRDKPVIASIYVDAAMRHLQAFFEGEEVAEDSGVTHLGHAIACAALLLDAQATGNLVDDRPKMSDNVPYSDVLKKLNAAIAKKSADASAVSPENPLSVERKASKPEVVRGEYLSVHGQPEEAEPAQRYSERPEARTEYPGIPVRGQPPHYT